MFCSGRGIRHNLADDRALLTRPDASEEVTVSNTEHPEHPERGDESAQAPVQQDSAQPESSPDNQQSTTPSQEGGTEGSETPPAEQPPAEQQGELSASNDAATDTKKGRKKGLVLGLGSAAVVVIVALGLAAFVWPGFLAGPGKPDAKAEQVVSALSSKNPGELEQISCHGPDGKSLNQIPPEALSMIQSVKQTGPAQLSLDTEAQFPIDLTVNAQGKTQNAPADAVLGVTDGDWCMKGLAQRQ